MVTNPPVGHIQLVGFRINSSEYPCIPTPPETNIEPENEPLKKEILTKNHHFQVLFSEGYPMILRKRFGARDEVCSY